MSLVAAAHVGHEVNHTSAFAGFLTGALIGGVLAVGIAVTVATGGLAAPALFAAFSVGVGVGSAIGEMVAKHLVPGSPSGPIAAGSPNVFINKESAAYCSSEVDCEKHSKQHVAQGSGNVAYNSLPAARKGDKGTCGFKIGEGSENVFIGGPMGGCGLPVGDEVPGWARGAVLLIGLAGGVWGMAARGICAWGIVGRLGAGITAGVAGGTLGNRLGGALFGEDSFGQDLLTFLGGEGAGRLAARGRLGRWLAGEPVDVVTGEVVVEQTDFELPAALPLGLSRYYASGLGHGCYFGPKWANSWGQFVTTDGVYARLHTDDARLLAFVLPEADEEVRHPFVGKLRLRKTARGFAVRDEANRTLRFETQAGDRLLLSAVEDANGYRISFTHDDRGALTEVAHSGGYLLRVEATPDAIHRVSLVDGDEGERELVRYGYDAAGRLAAVYNESGLPMRYEYDAAGRLVRWEDRRGTWFAYEYDAAGRVVRTRGVEGLYSGSFAYDEFGLRTSYTDSLDHTTTFTYNDEFQVVRIADARGGVTVNEFDARGNLTARTDPNGRTTRFEYDLDGNLIRRTDALGHAVSASYDERGLPELSVDAGGKAWQRSYDERGNLTRFADAKGVGWRYERDGRGNPVKITDALGNSCELGYDEKGLVVWATDWSGHRTEYRRDALGRVAERADALGRVTRFAYHAADMVSSVLLPTGQQVRREYDAERNLVRHRDADGRERRYEYGRFDLLLSERGPDGTRRRYRYDTEGRLAAVANEHGALYTYWRDAAGLVVRERDFSGRELRFERDAAGNVVRQVNALGQETTFEYDALDRLARKVNADGGETTFEYDAYGNITRARNPSCAVELERDEYGRVVREAQNGRAVESDYDALGRRLRRRVGEGGELGFEYDADGRLVGLRAEDESPSLTFAYDALGREVSRETGGGSKYLRSYDALGRVVEQVAHAGTPPAGGALQVGPEPGGAPPNATSRAAAWGGSSQVIAGRRYRYGQAESPQAVEDYLWGAAEYEYDASEQVVRVVREGQSAESYEYDETGQLIASGVGAQGRPAAAARAESPAPPWERDQGGRVLRTGRARYRYDAEGRVVAKIEGGGRDERQWQYSWDAEGRLSEVVTPRGERWRYEYDPFGRRTAKTSGAGGRVEYVWDGEVVAGEIKPAGGDGGTYVEWLFEPRSSTPLLKREGGETYYCLTDPQGAPRELMTGAGEVAWAAKLTLWGEVEQTAAGQTDCPVRFQGQWYDDESGLAYNFFRYYEAETAGYLSADPIRLDGGTNLYSYVPNPLVWIDPFGLDDTKGVYDVFHEARVDRSMYRASDPVHFRESNRQLYYAMKNDPALMSNLESRYPGIYRHVSPGPRGGFSSSPFAGTSWHHHPEVGGLLQLVDRADHNARHGDYHPRGVGGRNTWGGGTKCR